MARLRYGHEAMEEPTEDTPAWEDEVPEEEIPADLTEEQVAKMEEEK